jgi:hypothetical protein
MAETRRELSYSGNVWNRNRFSVLPLAKNRDRASMESDVRRPETDGQQVQGQSNERRAP